MKEHSALLSYGVCDARTDALLGIVACVPPRSRGLIQPSNSKHYLSDRLKVCRHHYGCDAAAAEPLALEARGRLPDFTYIYLL